MGEMIIGTVIVASALLFIIWLVWTSRQPLPRSDLPQKHDPYIGMLRRNRALRRQAEEYDMAEWERRCDCKTGVSSDYCLTNRELDYRCRIPGWGEDRERDINEVLHRQMRGYEALMPREMSPRHRRGGSGNTRS